MRLQKLQTNSTLFYSHRSQAAVRERVANKVRLKINESKTKYMMSVAIGDKTFRVSKEFVYLGSLRTPKKDKRQRRYQTANICFFGLLKQLKLGQKRSTKFII
jgi:hypothetical protein